MKNKYFLLMLVLLLAAGSGYYFFYRPRWSLWQRWPAPYQEGVEWLGRWEAAMKADTAGGKTPEATLNMFIAALRQQDVILASKYFLLDKDAGRTKWEKRLAELKEKDLLLRMADDIEQKAKPGTAAYEGDFGFVLYNSDNTIGLQIDMEFNEFSKVWKIESF